MGVVRFGVGVNVVSVEHGLRLFLFRFVLRLSFGTSFGYETIFCFDWLRD